MMKKSRKLYLTELFNNPAKGYWQVRNKDKWLGYFYIGKLTYTIEFNNIGQIGKLFVAKYNLPDTFWNNRGEKRKEAWVISFYVSQKKEGIKTYITAAFKEPDYANAIKTFATVISAIKIWLAKINPPFFILEAKNIETSQVKLYDRLMKKMEQDTNYKLHKKVFTDNKYRYLITDKNLYHFDNESSFFNK